MEEHQKFEYYRVRHPNRGIFWGIVLIMLGIIFVLQQVAGMSFDNWWALFILVPAFSSFAVAMRLYQTHNRVNNAVVSALFSGLIVLTVTLLFLFNLDWGIYWPLFILLPGLSMLVNGLLRTSSPSGRIANGLLKPWLVWIGGGAFLLGAGFLLKNLGIFVPAAIHYRWWAACILLVSLGG